jgi:hypothetical protein
MQEMVVGESKKNGSQGMITLVLDTDPAVTPEAGYRAGLLCPICMCELLDYDGLLNLVCPYCGVVQGGSFT